MNEEQLKRSLQSIGMGCFVKYFKTFKDSNKSKEDIIDGLMKIEGYEESGARTRVTQSQRIIAENQIVNALNIVIESSRAKEWTKLEAKYLLQNI